MSITLYQPSTRPWGMPNLSPFCTKLETYLRLRGIAHEVRPANMRKAPKGKIPYVRFDDGTLLGDSQHIIQRLEAEIPPGLDCTLTPVERAIGRLVQRTLDEGTYFVSMYGRWWTDDGFAELRPEFGKVLPGALRFLLPMIRGTVRKSLRGQGTGRHTPDEVQDIGKRDFDAVAEIIGERPFLLGERPSTGDCSAFAFVDGVLSFPCDSALKRHVAAKSNLVRYRDDLKAKYYPELVPVRAPA